MALKNYSSEFIDDFAEHLIRHLQNHNADFDASLCRLCLELSSIKFSLEEVPDDTDATSIFRELTTQMVYIKYADKTSARDAIVSIFQ